MSQFPTPPASHYSSESLSDAHEKPPVVDSSAELSQYLDALLERYLGLLDRHQALQADLAKQLSSVPICFDYLKREESIDVGTGISFSSSCQLHLSARSAVWN